MKQVLFLLSLLLLSSCKSDRISHTDCDYIYVWRYSINGDSILQKYNQPRLIERKIIGGRMKHRKLKVDLYNDGSYRSVKIPYGMNKSAIIRKARKATRNNPIIGVFKESFYPYYKVEFVKFK